MIIGICGLIGSGKGTVADIPVEHNFKKVSFADKLKDGVSTTPVGIETYPRRRYR